MRRRLRAAFVILLIGAFLIYWVIRSIEPQTVVACDFEHQPQSTTLRMPSGRGTLDKVRIEGRIGDTTQERMHFYDGLATWITSGEKAQGAISGDVWLAADGSVEGLFLTIVHPAFGQNELMIATLNGQGRLDGNRSTAFLSFEPNDKRSHPVSFSCRSARNYRHIYQRLVSFDALAGIGLALIVLAALVFARRKAESMDFRRR